MTSAKGSRQSHRLQRSRPLERTGAVVPMAESEDGAEEHAGTRAVEHGRVSASELGVTGTKVHSAVGSMGPGMSSGVGRHDRREKRRKRACFSSPIRGDRGRPRVSVSF